MCNVCIFVDDLRWMSTEPKYLLDDIEHLNSKFGRTKKLTLQEGKVTEFLGMVWDRTIDGECRITCPKGIKQLSELIRVSATRATPGDDTC